MLIAIATEGERKRLIIGLYEDNIERLINDDPISKNMDDLSNNSLLKGWDISIFGPEDTFRFVQAHGIKMIDPYVEALIAVGLDRATAEARVADQRKRGLLDEPL